MGFRSYWVPIWLLSRVWLVLSIGLMGAGWLLLGRRTRPAELWRIAEWILIGGLGLALAGLMILLLRVW